MGLFSQIADKIKNNPQQLEASRDWINSKQANTSGSTGSITLSDAYSNPNSALRKIMYVPVTRRDWHITDKSPASDVLASIYSIAETDINKANELYTNFLQQQATPSSPWYNPYVNATNNAIAEIAALGVDVSGGINEKFFNDNAWLKDHYRYGTGNSPLSPAKKATKEENAAYWYYKLLDAEETTQKAENEWAALQEEVSYWANRADRNYSFDEVLDKVNWSNYKTLEKLDADRVEGRATMLNRSIGYSRDNLRGVYWAAQNGSTGSARNDTILAALGEGKGWTQNDTIRNKLNPASADYSPYSVGSTLDDAALYFGVSSFGKDWLDRNRGLLASNDETAQKMYGKVYEAEQNTQKAEAELKELRDSMEDYLSGNKIDAEQVLSWLKDDYDAMTTLKRMDESREKGGGNLVATTRAVNYRWEDIEAEVRRRAEEKNKFPNTAVTLKNAYDRLGMKNNNGHSAHDKTENPSSEYVITNITPSTQESKDVAIGAANSIIQKDGTPAEKAVFKQAGSFNWTDFVRNMWHSLVGGDADADIVVQTEQQQAADYAADHYFDSRKTIDEYENAQKELDDARKTIDDILQGMPSSKLPGPGLVGMSANTGTSDQPMSRPLAPQTETEQRQYRIWASRMGIGTIVNPEIQQETYRQWRDSLAEEAQNLEDSQVEAYVSTLPPEVQEEYYAASKTIQENEAALADLQADYEQSQRYMEGIANRQDVAAQMAAANGVEPGPDAVQAMNDLYEIGAEYKPTQFSADTVFDAMVKEGVSKDEALAYAKQYAEQYEAELARIQGLLDAVPDKAKKGEVYDNVRREQERLERDLQEARDYLLQGEKDFDKTADEAIKKVTDATVNTRSALYAKGYSELDMLIADPSLLSRIAPDEPQYRFERPIGIMTDAERKTYFYIRETQGAEAAQSYYLRLTDDTHGILTTRQGGADAEAWDEYTKEHPIGANFWSIVTSPARITSGIYAGVQLAAGQDINPNSQWRAVSNFGNTVKSTSKQGITDYFGENTLGAKIANLGYDVFSSVGESTMNTLTFGGLIPSASGLGKIVTDFLGAVPMGLSAAGDAISEAVSKGADPSQALGIGAVTLLAEAGTEAITLGNMRDAFSRGAADSAAGLKAFIVDTIKDMGEEAAGEMINEAVESLADDAIMGELSQRQERIDYYMSADGGAHSQQEAEDLANREIVHNVLYAGLTGALSGAVTTTTSAAAGKVAQRSTNARISRNNIAILEEAAAADVASQTGAVAAVLATDETDMASMAAAVTMSEELGNEPTLNAIKHIEAVAARAGMQPERVHGAIKTAALGKGNSYGVLVDIAEHGATREKVNNLVEAAAADIESAEVQESIDQSTEDIRVAQNIRDQAANGAFDSVYASQQEEQKAKDKQRVAEKELERQQKKAEQLGDALMAAQEQYIQDPTNIKAEGALTQALNDIDGQNEVVQEYEQSLQNAEEAAAQAQRKHERETEKALAIAREQAEADVASEDMERELRERRKGYINDHLSGLSQSAREFVERLAAENGIDLDGSKEGLEFARAARDYYLNGRLGAEFDAKEHEKNSTLGEQIRKYAKQEKANETLEKATEKSADEIKEKYGIDKALEKDIKQEAERNGLQFDEDDPNWKKFLYLANLWYRNGFLGEDIPGNLQLTSFADQYIEALNGIRELGADDRLANQVLDEQANAQYNNNKEVSGNAVQPGSIDQGEGPDAGQLPATPGRDDGRGNNLYAEPGAGEGGAGRGTEGTAGRVGSDEGRVPARLLSKKGRDNLTNRGVTDMHLQEESNQERFSIALDEAKASSDHGAYVDPQSVEDLQEKGAKMIVAGDGLAGAAVGTKGKDAGNIFGVFKSKASQAKHASIELIIQAIAQGGNKLDCFDGALRGMYQQTGMVPVARVAFNEEFMPDGWNVERDDHPDVLFWMHNGDSADTVAEKYGLAESEGGYHRYTNDEINALPMFEDEGDVSGYERAWDYRDNLLAEAQKAAQEKDNTQPPITPNAYKGSNTKPANSTTGPVTSGQEIIKNLADALGIVSDTRTKKYLRHLRKKTDGYTNKNSIIHLQQVNDVRTAMHEIGHNLDIRMGMQSWVEDMTDFAERYNAQVDPDFLSLYKPEEINDELMAEFARVWMLDRNAAVNWAGDAFVNRFEQELKKNGWLQSMQDAAEQYNRWRTAESIEQVDSMVKMEVPEDKRKLTLSGVRNTLADHTLPLRIVQDNMKKINGRVIASEDARTLILEQPTIINNTIEHVRKDGLIDKYGEPVLRKDGTPYGGFDEITKKVGEAREKDFNNYMVLKLDQDRAPYGKNIVSDEVNVQEEIQKLDKKYHDFKDIHKEFVDWLDAFYRTWWVGNGIDEEQFDTLRALYPNFFPLKAATAKQSGKGSKRTDADPSYKVKKAFKNRGQDIYNPVLSTLEEIETLITKGKQIEAWRAFANQVKQLHSEGLDLNALAEPAQKDVDVENYERANMEAKKKLEDLLDVLHHEGKVSADAAEAVFDLMDELPSQGFVFSNTASGNDVINIPMEDGSIESWTIYNPEMMKALAYTRDGTPNLGLMRAMGTLNRILSVNATGRSIKFSVQNVLSDTETQANTGDTNFNNLTKDILWGFRPVHMVNEIRTGFELIKNMVADTALGGKIGLKTSEAYEAFKLFGKMGTRYALRDGKKQKEVRRELYRSKKSLKDVFHPLKWIEGITGFGEDMTRFGIFSHGGFDLSTYEGKLQAARAGAEGTVDFSKYGSAADSPYYKAAKAFIPFLNPQIQGIEKTIETLETVKNDPYKRKVILGRVALNSIVLGVLTAAARQILWGDDDKESYDQLTDYEKTKYIHLYRTSDGKWVKLKRSQDVLIQASDLFGEFAGEVLTGYEGDALADLVAGLRQAAISALPTTDTALQPAIDAWNGVTWYGQDIDTYNEQKQSMTARHGTGIKSIPSRLLSTWLEKAGVEISPNRIDYALETYLGSVGTLGTAVFDSIVSSANNKMLDGSALKDWFVNDIAEGFLIDPVYSNKIASGYYESRKKLDNVIAEAADGKSPVYLRANLSADELAEAIDEANALVAKGGAVYNAYLQYKKNKEQYNAVTSPDSTMTQAQQDEAGREYRHQMNLALMEANTAIADYFNKYGYENPALAAFYESMNILSGDTYKEKPVQAPSGMDALDQSFKNDSGMPYMQRATAVWNATGNDKALPHPNKSIKYTQNKQQYTTDIDSAHWDAYVNEYKHKYMKELSEFERSLRKEDKSWDSLTNDEKVDALGTIHSTAQRTATNWYKKTVLGIK